MAPLNAASQADMTAYTRQDNTPAAAPADQPSVPPNWPPQMPNRVTFMLASMPLMSAGGDALQRQFYGGPNVPSYRILPAKRGQSV